MAAFSESAVPSSGAPTQADPALCRPWSATGNAHAHGGARAPAPPAAGAWNALSATCPPPAADAVDHSAAAAPTSPEDGSGATGTRPDAAARRGPQAGSPGPASLPRPDGPP